MRPPVFKKCFFCLLAILMLDLIKQTPYNATTSKICEVFFYTSNKIQEMENIRDGKYRRWKI